MFELQRLWRELEDLRREIVKAFNPLWVRVALLEREDTAGKQWQVNDHGEEIVVTITLPAVRPGELMIYATPLRLELEAPIRSYIHLPFPVKPETARAAYRQGILEIKLKKLDNERRLPVFVNFVNFY